MIEILEIIVFTIFGIMIVHLVCSIIYLLSKGKILKTIYHDILQWHLVTDEDYINNTTFNGCNECNHCSICGKEVMQDSQGNWF